MAEDEAAFPSIEPERVDRDLEPKFLLVYTSPLPLGGFKIPRTHARTFETMDEMTAFLANTEIDPSSPVRYWPLGVSVGVRHTEVTEVKTVTEWSVT